MINLGAKLLKVKNKKSKETGKNQKENQNNTDCSCCNCKIFWVYKIKLCVLYTIFVILQVW